MGKRENEKLLKNIRYISVFTICMMLSTGFAFGENVNKFVPKLAFTVNSNEVLVGDNINAKQPFSRVVASPINVKGNVYVPIRGFSEIFGYSLGYNEISKAVTMTKEDKTVEYAGINVSDDLQKPNVYLYINGTSYAKVEEFALLEGLQISENKGIYMLYTQTDGSENDMIEYKDWFYVQDNKLMGTENLEQKLVAGLNFGNEDCIDLVKTIYDNVYYRPFINPYVPYSYTQMTADIEKLKAHYPEYIKTGSAGKSVEGRDLITIEFGNGPKHIYLFGSHHAREYISTTYIMKFINETAYAAKTGYNNTGYDVNSILNKVTYHIFPMVNPDGVNLVQNGIESVSPEYREQVRAMPFNGGGQYGYKTWKSNIRGVDINRNYPVAWEKIKNAKGASSSSYQGAYGASEPETQAVMNYLTLYKPEMVVSMHTQGQVIYWSNPNDNLGDVGRKMLQVSGFGPIAENRNKQDGGFLSNYIMTTHNAYEVTIELCKYVGPYPYPDAQFDTVWAPSKDLLLIVGDEIGKVK